MIKIIDLKDGHLIATYENDTTFDYIQHELIANGYDWVTMHNIHHEITITATPNK